MTRAISAPIAAALLILAGVTPLAAAPLSPSSLTDAATVPTARIVPAQYGDGPTTGAHHGRRNRSNGEASKSIDPSHADLHGATRESADKAYRKQYGF